MPSEGVIRFNHESRSAPRACPRPDSEATSVYGEVVLVVVDVAEVGVPVVVYVNVELFEVPESVFIVTDTRVVPALAEGTVAVQVVVRGQLVEAVTPPKSALTCPLGLKKPVPEMVTV